jgi:predicted transcriptional regulator
MSNKLKKDLLKAKELKQETKLVAVRIPQDVYKKVDRMAKDTNQSVSQVIIFALRESLK